MTISRKILRRVYCCNCGGLFADRKSLVLHIRNKKKGKYRDQHFGGDYVSGNKTGLIKFIEKLDDGKRGIK